MLNEAMLCISLWLAQDRALKAAAATDAPLSARAEELLREWEGRRNSVREARWDFERTLEDRTFGTTTVEKGEAAGVRPNLLRVNCRTPTSKPREIFLYHDDQMLWYDFSFRSEWIVPLNALRLAQGVDNKSWLTNWSAILMEVPRFYRDVFWGTSVEQMKSRFQVRLVKEDAYWAYFRLEPRKKPGNSDFYRAYSRPQPRLGRPLTPFAGDKEVQLVLDKETGRKWHLRWLDEMDNVVWFRVSQRESAAPTPITFESLSKDLPKDFKLMDQ